MALTKAQQAKVDELMTTYKRTGRMGGSKPSNDAAAKKQAISIAKGDKADKGESKMTAAQLKAKEAKEKKSGKTDSEPAKKKAKAKPKTKAKPKAKLPPLPPMPPGLMGGGGMMGGGPPPGMGGGGMPPGMGGY